MTDREQQGRLEAHTRAAPGADRPGSSGDPTDSSAGDQAPELTGADPEDLLAGLPEEQAIDVLELVAETTLTERRARGRPPGAANRKNADLIAYLAARGHRDPWVTLSLIQSADFAQLCRMVGADSTKTRLAVLKLQQSAAEAIMPYHHARKPQQLELPAGDKRPLMVIGEMNVTQINSHEGFMSAGVPVDQGQGNQGVIEGEPVREPGEAGEEPASD